MTRIVSVAEANRLVDQGAVLIDVREPDEHRRERIAGALSCPLSSDGELPHSHGALIFHCASGARTKAHAKALAAKASGRDCFVLEGGIARWKQSGLPVERTKGAPIELQRQVMIVAGSLVLVGALLAALVSTAFLALPLFVGAGLLLAGVSGFCGMARLLMKAPWNRASTASA